LSATTIMGSVGFRGLCPETILAANYRGKDQRVRPYHLPEPWQRMRSHPESDLLFDNQPKQSFWK